VIAVAVRQDDGGYRLRSDFGDILQQFSSTRGSGLCLDDDDAFVADNYAAVSAAALHPVNVWLRWGTMNGAGGGACALAEAARAIEAATVTDPTKRPFRLRMFNFLLSGQTLSCVGVPC
jgi:hypothetical protein